MLSALGSKVRAAIAQPLHSNVLGVARTVIALGTLGTLLFSRASDILRPAVGFSESPHCASVGKAGLFCLTGADHLELGRWLAVAALLLVASGWRPRLTGLLHWYVVTSLFSSGTLVDGGDQAAVVLTFLLVPITLADPRRWHWSAAPPVSLERTTARRALGASALRLLALTCAWALRLQMAGIYFQACVSKLKVPEWQDGTAVYYWFTDPWFGIPEPVRSLVMPLLTNGMVVTAITWGALALEIFLFSGLVATRRTRRALLVLGISFHAMIALIHGLLSFALVMWGGLILFLRPLDQEFAAVRRLTERLGDGVRLVGARVRRRAGNEGEALPTRGARGAVVRS
ncbi:MAG: HTTM domain-containing protein [Kofleriaceae bacterium]